MSEFNIMNDLLRIRVKKDPPLFGSEIRLFAKLKENRRIAVEQVIPKDMKFDFITSVFPDRQLELFVKSTYRRGKLKKDSIGRMEFLIQEIKNFLSSEYMTGWNLTSHFGINQDSIVEIMLRGVEELIKEQ